MLLCFFQHNFRAYKDEREPPPKDSPTPVPYVLLIGSVGLPPTCKTSRNAQIIASIPVDIPGRVSPFPGRNCRYEQF